MHCFMQMYFNYTLTTKNDEYCPETLKDKKRKEVKLWISFKGN